MEEYFCGPYAIVLSEHIMHMNCLKILQQIPSSKYFLQTLFLTISKIEAKLKYLLDSGLLPSMFAVIEVTFQNLSASVNE